MILNECDNNNNVYNTIINNNALIKSASPDKNTLNLKLKGLSAQL